MQGPKRTSLREQARAYRETLRRHTGANDSTAGKARFYLGLLIFTIFVGIPILAIPAARGRLSHRMETFYQALGPPRLAPSPAWEKVGENRFPVPEEFVRPVIQRPAFTGMIRFPGTVYGTGGEHSIGTQASKGADAESPTPSAVDSEGPQFRQGKPEQEAYELLLSKQATLASMVLGGNPALTFKSWSAALQEEGTYLVDVVFLRGPEKVEVHFIWRVEVLEKKILPMSHEARSLSKL